MTFKLHDYQKEIVNKARSAIGKGNKGVLIQSPPGSGKSVVIAEIIKNASFKGNRVLFLIHRKELAEQITNTLKYHQTNLKYVNVMTIGKAANRINTMPTPKIIVTDESHHSRASTYKKVYDAFPDALKLGFTATPWRMDGTGFTDLYDTAIYGKTVDWLIQNNKLAPFKYLSIKLIDEKQLKKSRGEFTSKSIDEAFEKGIYGDVVNNYVKYANGQKSILYAHNVEASKHFAEQFNLNNIRAVHADAKTPKSEREKIMQDFRDGYIKVLCNVDLISEGFDVPDCTCVIQARPTSSLVLYMQQAMRSMRYQADKVATIIDHVGNYSRHGLPNQSHDWKKYFEGGYKKKKRKEETIGTTECNQCFAVYETKKHGNICPYCGHEVIKLKEDLQHFDAELEEITNFEIDYTLVDYANKNESELETLEDYYLYAKAKNFKEGWIKFRYTPLKNAPWPIFYNELKPLKEKYNY